jgi:putative chitinase
MLTIQQINKLMSENINIKSLFSVTGLAMFLAQCDHESMGFNVMEENLNYSAERLMQVFPLYFNVFTAPEYAHNPQKIANKVYANRMGNGDEDSGDGYKYRGRGYIQLTGKDNYTVVSNALHIDCVTIPEFVIVHAFDVAIWFFQSHNILNNTDIKTVTLKINGGYNGLEERNTLFQQYKTLLNTTVPNFC